MRKKNHFIIDVLEWAEKRSEGFTHNELMSSLSLREWERRILIRYFENAETNGRRKNAPNLVVIPETIFYVIEGEEKFYGNPEVKFILTTDALFQFTDYEELKFARENAEDARELAKIAIAISFAAAIISIFIPIFIAQNFTQKVEIVDRQFLLMKSSVASSTNE